MPAPKSLSQQTSVHPTTNHPAMKKSTLPGIAQRTESYSKPYTSASLEISWALVLFLAVVLLPLLAKKATFRKPPRRRLGLNA